MARAPSKTLEVTVANIKSQKKRILTNAKAADRNCAVRSELKTRVKSATASIGTDDDSSLRIAMSKIDRAVAKGILHKNPAARKKSRLMQKINAGS
jgi:small subunit ribosomal protein S20